MDKVEIVEINGKNYIVVNNEVFDWEVDPDQLRMVEFKIKNDPLMKDHFIGSLFNHLTACFSEFVGKKVSLKEINDIINKGGI